MTFSCHISIVLPGDYFDSGTSMQYWETFHSLDFLKQATGGLLALTTPKEIQELDISALTKPLQWLEDSAEYNIMNLHVAPETLPASDYLVVQTPADNIITNGSAKNGVPGSAASSVINSPTGPTPSSMISGRSAPVVRMVPLFCSLWHPSKDFDLFLVELHESHFQMFICFWFFCSRLKVQTMKNKMSNWICLGAAMVHGSCEKVIDGALLWSVAWGSGLQGINKDVLYPARWNREEPRWEGRGMQTQFMSCFILNVINYCTFDTLLTSIPPGISSVIMKIMSKGFRCTRIVRAMGWVPYRTFIGINPQQFTRLLFAWGCPNFPGNPQ